MDRLNIIEKRLCLLGKDLETAIDSCHKVGDLKTARVLRLVENLKEIVFLQHEIISELDANNYQYGGTYNDTERH